MLAVIPAAVFAAAYAVQSRPGKPPDPPRPTYAEQVHRDVVASFDQRFGNAPDPAVRRVRTVTIIPVRIPAETPQPSSSAGVARPAPETSAPVPVSRRIRLVRKVSLDICQRHGMHRVNYGKRWRCRR
jgi:hypothetical protein